MPLKTKKGASLSLDKKAQIIRMQREIIARNNQRKILKQMKAQTQKSHQVSSNKVAVPKMFTSRRCKQPNCTPTPTQAPAPALTTHARVNSTCTDTHPHARASCHPRDLLAFGSHRNACPPAVWQAERRWGCQIAGALKSAFDFGLVFACGHRFRRRGARKEASPRRAHLAHSG